MQTPSRATRAARELSSRPEPYVSHPRIRATRKPSSASEPQAYFWFFFHLFCFEL
ncbi:hypothetical protein IC582_023769 [Cucumis melo]